MNCPRGCGPLAQRKSSEIVVDVCPSCRGIWLDAGEFDPLVAERFAGEPLEAYFALTAEPSVRAAAICPVDGAEMGLVRFDDLELDWCGDCHGIWIDGYERDELAATKTARASKTAHEEQGRVSFDEDSVQEADALRHPGMVEFVPEGPLEHSLELDLSTSERMNDSMVACAACGTETVRDRAMRRMDAFWCEACVVKGDFPGSHGPPVSKRLAEAAMAMSKAQVRLEDKKGAVKEMKRKRELVKQGINRHNDMLVADAVHATAKAVWNLFRRDK